MDYKPRPYQKIATELILKNPAVALWLDMGLGKTVATLTAIEGLIYDSALVSKVLVIAPKQVAMSTWPDEIKRWAHTKDLRYSLVMGSAEVRKKALGAKADIYIINRELVPWLVQYYGRKWPFDMVVIDESSSFKNPQAKRFKALKKVRPMIHRMVELTGTPSPNGYLDLWSQVYLLDQGERLDRSFTAYRSFYFKPSQYIRQSGHMIACKYELLPGSKALIQKRLEDICFSMSAKDWLSLPARLDNKITVTIPDMAPYKALERDLVIQLEYGTIAAPQAATLVGKLLQMANGAVYDDQGQVQGYHEAKLDALESVIEESESVLVFYNFKHDLSRIKRRFPTAREIKGPEDIEAWNAGRIRILLAHPASAGHGLNLQYGGHVICWYGLTWSLELYQQANARLHRQGQDKPVIVHHLVAKGTIDELVLKALKDKKQVQDYILEKLKISKAEAS